MIRIPDDFKDLLDRPILVALATVQPGGQPQITPVWADQADGYVRFNTAAGRQKWKNLTERPQVTVMVVDPDNDQRYIEIRGTVARVEDDTDLINKLSNDYIGQDSPYLQGGETRVTFLIEPTKIFTQG